MEDFNKKIDSIIDWLTEPDGGNAVTESDIRDAIIEINELRRSGFTNNSELWQGAREMSYVDFCKWISK